MINLKITASIATFMLAMSSAQAAGITHITEAAFTADAGLITFSEFPQGTVNPTYAPAAYGSGATAPTINFGGFFAGQALGTPGTCPAGAAVSGCVTGTSSNALALDPLSHITFITGDGADPTSPVLSGNPIFNGPVSILFDHDIAGIGLNGGFFDAIGGGTAITAFARDGSILGSVSNTGFGIEFLGWLPMTDWIALPVCNSHWLAMSRLDSPLTICASALQGKWLFQACLSHLPMA